MANEKMTMREFYAEVENFMSSWLADDADPDEDMVVPLRDKARELLAKLDEKNASRKPSKASVASSNRRDLILALLMGMDTPIDGDTIASTIGCTKGEATSACSALVREGKVAKESAKTADKRTVVVYSAIKAE